MQYIFRGTIKEVDQVTDAVKREVAEIWLRSQRDWDAPAPTAEEITIAIAEWEAEQSERLDLADLGRQVAAELAWLDTTIAGIDGYTAAQVRDVVKRLCQEQRAVLKALRYVVRQGK